MSRWQTALTITRSVGFAILRVDKHFTIDEVVFAEPGDMTLLGARTLEGLSLVVDARRKKLVAAGLAPSSLTLHWRAGEETFDQHGAGTGERAAAEQGFARRFIARLMGLARRWMLRGFVTVRPCGPWVMETCRRSVSNNCGCVAANTAKQSKITAPGTAKHNRHRFIHNRARVARKRPASPPSRPIRASSRGVSSNSSAHSTGTSVNGGPTESKIAAAAWSLWKLPSVNSYGFQRPARNRTPGERPSDEDDPIDPPRRLGMERQQRGEVGQRRECEVGQPPFLQCPPQRFGGGSRLTQCHARKQPRSGRVAR